MGLKKLSFKRKSIAFKYRFSVTFTLDFAQTSDSPAPITTSSTYSDFTPSPMSCISNYFPTFCSGIWSLFDLRIISSLQFAWL